MQGAQEVTRESDRVKLQQIRAELDKLDAALARREDVAERISNIHRQALKPHGKTAPLSILGTADDRLSLMEAIDEGSCMVEVFRLHPGTPWDPTDESIRNLVCGYLFRQGLSDLAVALFPFAADLAQAARLWDGGKGNSASKYDAVCDLIWAAGRIRVEPAALKKLWNRKASETAMMLPVLRRRH